METDVSPIMGFWTQANTTPSYNTTLVDIGPLPNGSCWSVRNPGPDCFHIWRDIYFYVAAVIMPLGLIFNSVSFGIFFTSWMRHTTPGRYFMTLALADNLVLLSELLMWLNTMDIYRGSKLGVTFFHEVDVLCKLLYVLKYGSRVWSSWVIVSITIERFLTVTFPFKFSRISSPTNVLVVVAAEAVMCFGLALFPIFTVASQEYMGSIVCLIMDIRFQEYHYMVSILIAGIGELVLPSLIMLIFTALIIWRLLIAQRRRLLLSQCESTSQRRQLQSTIALVLVALTFVTVRLPYLITYFVNQFSGGLFTDITGAIRLRIYAAYKVSQALSVANYAINFFLFCMAGNTFREEVLKCCYCCCHLRRQRGPIRRGQQQRASITSTLTVVRDSLIRDGGMRDSMIRDSMMRDSIGSHKTAFQMTSYGTGRTGRFQASGSRPGSFSGYPTGHASNGGNITIAVNNLH